MCQNYILIDVENNYIHKSIAITLNKEHAGASKPFMYPDSCRFDAPNSLLDPK